MFWHGKWPGKWSRVLEVNEGDEDGEFDKGVNVPVFKKVVNGAFTWLVIHGGNKLKCAIKKEHKSIISVKK